VQVMKASFSGSHAPVWESVLTAPAVTQCGSVAVGIPKLERANEERTLREADRSVIELYKAG